MKLATLWFWVAEWRRLRSSPILRMTGFTVREMVEMRKRGF